MAASPICTVDGVGVSNGKNVTPGATVTIALQSTANVSIWSIRCTSSDETTDAEAITSSLSVNYLTKTATFTAPAAGKALIFQSKVNNGLSPDGVADDSLTTTFGVYTLTTSGLRVIASQERNEAHAVYGWITSVNAGIRLAAANPAPTVSAIAQSLQFTLAAGTPLTITGTGFLAGATVSIGGVAATSVVVVNSTTITCNSGTFGVTGFKDVVVTNTDSQFGTLTNGYLALSAFVWFRSQVGDYVLDGGGSNVGTMTDLSGSGNSLVSTGSGAGPTVSANQIGGKQAFRFQTGLDFMAKASFSGPSAAEVFFVKKNFNTSSQGLWIVGSSGVQDFHAHADTHVYDSWGSTTRKDTGIPGSVTLTNGHIFNARSSTGSYAAAFNSLADYFTTGTNAVGWNGTFTIGKNTIGTAWNGYFGELVAFPNVLTTNERTAVRNYLTTYWTIV